MAPEELILGEEAEEWRLIAREVSTYWEELFEMIPYDLQAG
jgi:hypothetical protein